MRKERNIIIKVIKKDDINYRRLAKYFAEKYRKESVEKS